MTTQTAQAIQPFIVTVTRNGRVWNINVRGTHDMLYRLCERIDQGRGKWGEEFGPLHYKNNTPRNGEPTTYDDRAPVHVPAIVRGVPMSSNVPAVCEFCGHTFSRIIGAASCGCDPLYVY
jgi:hypothetical protein